MKRKYYRRCGNCGERLEQSEMVRTELAENGWLCKECYEEAVKKAADIRTKGGRAAVCAQK